MKTLLKGGTVVSAAGSRVADVLVDGEKIAAVGEGLAVDGAKVVDVRGKLLFPGFIDAHTHFDLDVCNTTTADNFDTGTRSAIHGGTTMVIDFARIRARRWATGLISGTKRPTAGPAATIAST